MRCLALTLVLALLGFPMSAVTAADAKSDPAVEVSGKTAALVRQLGADAYEVREAATKELEKLGKTALKALEEGVKDEDMEISSRSKRLLALATRSDIEVALDSFLADKDTKLILKLPAWERFKKVLGDDQSARTLFVEMYTTEGCLLASLEREPKNFDQTFTTRCQQIQQNLYTPFGQVNQIPMGQMVALLFAATDPRTTTNINSFYLLTNLLYQQNIQQGFKSNAGARKLLAEYFEQRADQNTMPQAIQLAMQMEIKEMAPTALKAATNKNSQQWTRATALLALGKLGTKDNLKDIEPLLKDETALGTMRFIQRDQQQQVTKQVTTQMRDVALASMIMLSGQNVQNYDFPYLKMNNLPQNQYLSYNCFGFSDNGQREAALKKFQESRVKHEKKEEKK
jgi:hypothetical protein